jgi:hypothetical protein
MYDAAEISGICRRAFVVGYSGERDSGMKWEKTSV